MYEEERDLQALTTKLIAHILNFPKNESYV